MKNRSFVWTFMILCFFVVSLSRCDCGAQGTPTVDISMGDPVLVTTQNIGFAGGVISVNDGGALDGLTITFPQGSVTDTTEIKVSYAEINASGSTLPSETKPVSVMLVLEAPTVTQFDKPVEIKLPYDLASTEYNEFINAYEYVVADHTIEIGAMTQDKQEKRLEVASMTARDTTTGTVSFMVRHFSYYFALEWAKKVADVMATSVDFNYDTGFRSAVDGWFIPNYGSILNPGGNCIGMSSYAKWFFTWKSILGPGGSAKLFEKYRQGDRERWEDDECAFEAASRMQLGESAIWTASDAAMQKVGFSSLQVAQSFVQALRDTGQPQIVYLAQEYADGTWGGAHAVLIYGYSNGSFNIYDPNAKGEERTVTYTYGGNWGIYNSGTTAASSRFKYNIFGIVGPSLFHGFSDAANIYVMAEKDPCFKDESLFPEIELTSPTDTNDDTKLDVTVLTGGEVGTTLTGTITGGSAQPTHTNIYVNGTRFSTAIAADGSFSQKVPLFCETADNASSVITLESSKDNVVEFVVTEANEWQKYAGYAKYIINCTGPIPLGKVTLTWDTPLDIDLHLVTPALAFPGIYYANKAPVGPYPYLDFDDTTGTGPEHMFFDADKMITSGTYEVLVKYFSKASYETAPSVRYTIKVELGFMLADGVPVYEEPQYYYGTLTSVGQVQSVTTFTYPSPTINKTLTEGQQGI